MKPDAGLIVAVQRNQTGANIHTLNNLLHQYEWACHLENHTLADHARQELMAVLIESEWRQAREETESHKFLGWAG
jgi:hypothetical protein